MTSPFANAFSYAIAMFNKICFLYTFIPSLFPTFCHFRASCAYSMSFHYISLVLFALLHFVTSSCTQKKHSAGNSKPIKLTSKHFKSSLALCMHSLAAMCILFFSIVVQAIEIRHTIECMYALFVVH